MLTGIDISTYQGSNIDFDTLKLSTDFCISRCSFGCPDLGESITQYMDPDFKRDRNEALRVGLSFGAYHYSYPELNSPENEATQFYDALIATGGLQENVIYALDYEENSTVDMDTWCSTFLSKFASLTGGYKALLYIDKARATAIPWTQTIALGTGLWLAEWDFNANSPMDPNTPWAFVAFRQYTDKNTVDGINPVDGDVFYGDLAAFNKYGWHATTTTTTTTTTTSLPIITTTMAIPTSVDSITAPTTTTTATTVAPVPTVIPASSVVIQVSPVAPQTWKQKVKAIISSPRFHQVLLGALALILSNYGYLNPFIANMVAGIFGISITIGTIDKIGGN